MNVAACLPDGQLPEVGRPVEVWAPASEPGARDAVIRAAQHWSRYLLDCCGLQLAEGGTIAEAERAGGRVVLLCTVLV